MKVALVHYHLDIGGVNTVIRSHSLFLIQAGVEHVILTGPPRDTEKHSELKLPAKNHLVIDELGYGKHPIGVSPAMLLGKMRSEAAKILSGPVDVWHFHNHSLGKSSLMSEIVALLAQAGERLLLQMHDFSEDGRPENYRLIYNKQALYPVGSRIRYAFLTEHALGHFLKAGLPKRAATILRNTVQIPKNFSVVPASANRWLFAPIRGIRRKNLGELLLISLMVPTGTRIAIARAPTSGQDLETYRQWRDFSTTRALPIDFDVVGRISPAPNTPSDFDSWIAHSSHLITTSVAEGFGFVFADSVALRKPLIGRNLGIATDDLISAGATFPHLYNSFQVPVRWMGSEKITEALLVQNDINHRLYKCPPTAEDFSRIEDWSRGDDRTDYGNLTESIQRMVLLRLLEGNDLKELKVRVGTAEISAAEWFDTALRDEAIPSGDLPKEFTERHVGAHLLETYSGLMKSTQKLLKWLNQDDVLTNFIGATNVHFLKSPVSEMLLPKARVKAVIFDVYGTLLEAASGGVRNDPKSEVFLRERIVELGFSPPELPGAELHQAVLDFHARSSEEFPEVDLRRLWMKILSIGSLEEAGEFLIRLESIWHPATPIGGAKDVVRKLSENGVKVGLISNAQWNTLPSLGEFGHSFDPSLSIFSYVHGCAKPSPRLFQTLLGRLDALGITPQETVVVGNDPLADIIPALAHGMMSALYVGNARSFRAGDCRPDFRFAGWEFFEDWVLHDRK